MNSRSGSSRCRAARAVSRSSTIEFAVAGSMAPARASAWATALSCRTPSSAESSLRSARVSAGPVRLSVAVAWRACQRHCRNWRSPDRCSVCSRSAACQASGWSLRAASSAAGSTVPITWLASGSSARPRSGPAVPGRRGRSGRWAPGLFGVLGQRLQGPPGALRERLQDGGRPPAEGQDEPGRAAQRLRQAKVGGRVGGEGPARAVVRPPRAAGDRSPPGPVLRSWRPPAIRSLAGNTIDRGRAYQVLISGGCPSRALPFVARVTEQTGRRLPGGPGRGATMHTMIMQAIAEERARDIQSRGSQ